MQAPAPGSAAGAARVAAALDELGAGLRLLATLCSRDPQTALDLLHVELPTNGSAEGQRGPDLLSLAVQAVAVLAAQPQPPAAVIGGWGGPWGRLSVAAAVRFAGVGAWRGFAQGAGVPLPLTSVWNRHV